MKLHHNKHRSWYALGAALAIAASTALANTSTPQPAAPETAVNLALADGTDVTPGASGSTAPRAYPASEAGVRRAAAQGPAELHHYIYRTRMIYNYYFWDFAKEE